MSTGFKITISTFSLIISIIFSYLWLTISALGSVLANVSFYFTLPVYIAPLVFIFYIIYLITKKQVFFWITVIPGLIILLLTIFMIIIQMIK